MSAARELLSEFAGQTRDLLDALKRDDYDAAERCMLRRDRLLERLERVSSNASSRGLGDLPGEILALNGALEQAFEAARGRLLLELGRDTRTPAAARAPYTSHRAGSRLDERA